MNFDKLDENSLQQLKFSQVIDYADELGTKILFHTNCIKEIYPFKSLEKLILNPIEYVHCMYILLTNTDDEIEKQLTNHIHPNQALSIMITYKQYLMNKKHNIEDNQKKMIDDYQLIIKLYNQREMIKHYISKHVESIAPNVSKLVGITICAELLAITGGIKELSLIPACNIKVLGQSKKQKLINQSASYSNLHLGIIYNCPLIQSIDASVTYKRKLLRLLSNKIALAARIDVNKSDINGIYGLQLKNELINKLKLWLKPANKNQIKALPIPNEGKYKKKKRWQKI